MVSTENKGIAHALKRIQCNYIIPSPATTVCDMMMDQSLKKPLVNKGKTHNQVTSLPLYTQSIGQKQ
jgi:hypothetical protein